MEIRAFGISDVGCKREHNEDFLLMAEDIDLYIVCDGMGGALAGEVASQRAAEVVEQVIRQRFQQVEAFLRDPTNENRQQLINLVEESIHLANAEVFRMATQDRDKRGMGTTLVLTLFVGEHAIMAHVGDSRIYLLRANHIHQLTEDHSLVAEQLRRGLITPEEAESSNLGNVIMRAVGTREVTQVDTLHLELMPGDRFVLCSDGLHGLVKSPDIGSVIAALTVEDSVKQLVAMANDGGGHDNITALVVHVDEHAELTCEVPGQQKFELMQRIPLFSHLTYKELATVIEVATEREFAQGDVIIAEDDVEDEFFILLRGRAAVTKHDRPLANLREGAHFGEMCLLDDAPRSATITAGMDCKVLAIRRSDFYPVMQREPVLAVKLLWAFCQELIGRLRDTSAELSGAQVQLDHMIARQVPFATHPGIDAIPTRQGMSVHSDDITIPNLEAPEHLQE
jgi:serine/threonine protein phosphatase PrpC/CRP-like cAMP-binding protein